MTAPIRPDSAPPAASRADARTAGPGQSPRRAGFSQPAEWAPHRSCWVAWPSHADLWLDNLEPARREFADMCRSIALPEGGRPEPLEVLVPDAAREALARAALAGLPARFHHVPFGDIWLRDTAPVFVRRGGDVAAVRFRFNGWGGKYVLEHDDAVGGRVAAAAGVQTFELPLVLEGGGLEVDGEGTCLTTRSCVLSPERNPGLDEAAASAALREALGVAAVLWLDQGLLNDHTDGHIDTLARFVAPGVVVCMAPSGSDDPNREVLEAIARDLGRLRDARGRRLEVVRVPSPGLVQDADGRVLPASHVNFYIANGSVTVPVYGTKYDDAAVAAIGALFPGRRTTGVSARAILSGGGAFHCITQQQPEAGE